MPVAGRLRAQSDDSNVNSLSHRFRSRRFTQFEKKVARLPRPLHILDIGGTTAFWEQRGWAGRDDIRLTLVNLVEQEQRHENIEPTVGNACDLSSHPDGAFGLVFSNSVIEHLFTLGHQEAMAREVRRLAPAHWIQTPNFWFPVEPHFLALGWQYLPQRLRVEIIMRRSVGQLGRTPDRIAAEDVVREVRLMRRGELRKMFPGSTIVAERLGGLVKSWIVTRGL